MAGLRTIQHLSAPQRTERGSNVVAVLDTNRIRLLLIGAVCLLGLVYLWLVNSSATAGFYLSDLQQSVASLDKEYQHLQTEQAALSSLGSLEDRSQALSLVDSGPAQYVAGTQAVAVTGY